MTPRDAQVLLQKKPLRGVDYKIVLLGESSVGKSSILERLQNNSFNDSKSSTIGAAFVSKKIIHDDDLINLQIWDTAGQERFHNLTPLYYRNSNIAIVVFDLNNLQSLKKADFWIDELKNYIDENDNNSMKIVLVGNKSDLLVDGECIFQKDIDDFLQQYDSLIIKYFVTSAKLNLNIVELFDYITSNIDDSLFYKIDENGNDISDDNNKGKLIDLNFSKKNISDASNLCQC